MNHCAQVRPILNLKKNSQHDYNCSKNGLIAIFWVTEKTLQFSRYNKTQPVRNQKKPWRRGAALFNFLIHPECSSWVYSVQTSRFTVDQMLSWFSSAIDILSVQSCEIIKKSDIKKEI